MKVIQVIEDEQDILDNISKLLEFAHYSVIANNTGLDGIESAKSKIPDLIICDIMLPDISGFKVFEALKNFPATSTIPFVFLTAKISDADIRFGMNLGADDYIKKPFENEELLTAINTRLQKRQLIDNAYDYKIESIRNNLSFSIPHEFYTPLNGIIGLSQLIKKHFDTFSEEDLLSMVDNIYDSAIRLNRLISNYVYYVSLIEKLRIQQSLPKDFSSAKPIIEEQSMRIANQNHREQDFNFDIEDATIDIPESFIIKLLQELIDNALKFSNQNTKISITGKLCNNQYILSIHNFGRGLTNEQIKNIGAYMQFDREFYEQQGMGLGLAITQKIAELFHADFCIQSIPEYDFNVSIAFKLAN